MLYRKILLPIEESSCFLFGPRQVGKSTYAKSLLTENSLYIDLLPQKEFIHYSNTPGAFREEVLTHFAKVGKQYLCVVDEIQKVPQLLDEVHALIESHKIFFLLTGSSSRKLKRTGVNLLAGRALTYRAYPLTYSELDGEFNLEKALVIGTLPKAWNLPTKLISEFLYSYGETYLSEEIAQEGIIRNLAPFGGFLKVASACDGQLVNYTAIASEVGVASKTIKEYYQILEDTFIGFRLAPLGQSIREQQSAHPKFYFFDTGITNALSGFGFNTLPHAVKGMRFEQLFINQLKAELDYERKRYDFNFWRDANTSEIDLVISRAGEVVAAIEIKLKPHSMGKTIRSFNKFAELYKIKKATKLLIAAPVPRARIIEGTSIEITPWMDVIEILKSI